MLGTKGQEFDAFKLLIAAVVAGAILVILLGMLGGFITPASDPTNLMSQSISTVKGAPGSGKVSSQTVQFSEGDIVSAEAVSTKAGVNPGQVKFCVAAGGTCASACPDEYVFGGTKSGIFFAGPTDVEVSAAKAVSGKIRVYNCGADETYWVGFKPVS